MNFYLKSSSFAPAFGPFGAKRCAFWCKTQCILVQNAVQFGAKRNAIWCKTQCILVLNAVHFGAKRSEKCC